ncbi:hypothetical protein KC356_g4821 [Hortaea werneckii]|nr:hypothetical protein KC356_g4821 [Hortaea werneckii]
MSFPRQPRVAPSNDDDNQQDILTFSSSLQGHAPLASMNGYTPPFLFVDEHDLAQADNYQRNMVNRSHDLDYSNTPQQFLGPHQAANSSNSTTQHSAVHQQGSQLNDDGPYEQLANYYLGILPELALVTTPKTNKRKAHTAWDASNQRASPQTIVPALLDKNYSNGGFEVAPMGINQPLQHPQAGPTPPTLTNHELPITAGHTKRRKVLNSETDSSQPSIANFTASQQDPSYGTGPTASHIHYFNTTQHGTPYNYSPDSMLNATPNFTEKKPRPLRPIAPKPSGVCTFPMPSNSVYPAANMPVSNDGQAFNYGIPTGPVPPQIQYQQPAGNHNVHHDAWSGPPSGQYGVGFPSASMAPAQPASLALTPFNQHDNTLWPSMSHEQDFSHSSSASSPPFDTQQPAEYDIFHQDVWSSPPTGQCSAELPTSSIPTAQQTTSGFLQNSQQSHNFSSGPQINVLQQNNIFPNAVQVNQPSNVLSSGPQVNQQNNVLSSGPQVNQQAIGIPPANGPPAQSASFVPPQINQQSTVPTSGPQVNQQNVGIQPPNGPPAQPAASVTSQANQQGNVPTTGPQANQQNNLQLIGPPVILPFSTTQTSTGAHRSAGHNADWKFLQAVPSEAALPAMDLSLTELLTYFPLHTTWYYVMLRFKAAEASPWRIAQGKLLMRGVVNDQRATKTDYGKIRHQIREAGNVLLGGNTIYTSQDAENQLKTLAAGRVSYDVSAYTTRSYYSNKVADMKLVDIARGVRMHPTGEEAGKFTKVVQHVLANLNTLADTTTVGAVILANDPQLAFSYPAERATTNWDKKCLERMMQRLAANGM